MLLAYVEGTPVDCGEIYQKLLGDVVTMKKSCDTAKFKDCCQVDIIIVYIANNYILTADIKS